MSGEGDDGTGGTDADTDPNDGAGSNAAGSDAPRVRVRGIYTTALTRLLDGGAEVVLASEPIRDRFDAGFGVAPPDATVSTTRDRQGVGIAGGSDAVEEVRSRLDRVGVGVHERSRHGVRPFVRLLERRPERVHVRVLGPPRPPRGPPLGRVDRQE